MAAASCHDLVDIGANLAHESFDQDRDEVIARARAAGVRRLIVTGSTVASSLAAAALAHRLPGCIYATAGVHPHHATDFGPDAAAALVELATRSGVVAIGECGLDYYRNFSPARAQRLAFERQLSLAATTGKPVFLHQRDAHEDFVAILADQLPRLIGGVAHCFTGPRAQLEQYVGMGLYIGITGWICDDRRGEDLRRAVEALPIDRVMLETDAPYLLPRNLQARTRNRRNEPAHLPAVLETTARCMGVDPAVLAAASTANAELLFGLQSTAG
ncbi:MAG: hydrolase TatD [Gammaproteobacteria bacterium]|nr:hydrolase TatD [Gammaproteobacteria bacterium]